MGVQFKKNGTVSMNNLRESDGMNLLTNSEKYTAGSPYVVTGTGSDIIATTDMYCQITPGETYYLIAESNPGWADGHGYTDARKGKGIIWLYLSKVYNPDSTGYDSPVSFGTASSTKIRDGVWKYTIPSEYNMARIRLNTYSNGTDSVTCKFWNVKLIPEKYYTTHLNDSSPALKVGKDSIVSTEIYEI